MAAGVNFIWRSTPIQRDAAVELTGRCRRCLGVADLLARSRSVGSMTGDGAYDGQVVYDALGNVIRSRCHHPASIDRPFRAKVRPHSATSISRQSQARASGWQRSSGYCRRSLVETAMYRYKTIIGRRLHARTLPNQKTEAKIGCNVLNRMTSLGMPSPFGSSTITG